MLFCNFVFGSEKGGARLVIFKEKTRNAVENKTNTNENNTKETR